MNENEGFRVVPCGEKYCCGRFRNDPGIKEILSDLAAGGA
jgi:hypothetical protein